MFEILVYLFENYLDTSAYPDEGKLTQQLTEAGYEDSEIRQAFRWLDDLEGLALDRAMPEALAASASIRCYADFEQKVLDVDARGVLMFLSAAGILNPIQREWVIDRVLALGDVEVSLDQLKWIVLMVLYSQGSRHDYLFMEDLLFGEGEPLMH